jgi:hypothetical protein
MEVTKGKLLSLVIAGGYAVAMIVQARGISAEVVKGCLVLVPAAGSHLVSRGTGEVHWLRRARRLHRHRDTSDCG